SGTTRTATSATPLKSRLIASRCSGAAVAAAAAVGWSAVAAVVAATWTSRRSSRSPTTRSPSSVAVVGRVAGRGVGPAGPNLRISMLNAQAHAWHFRQAALERFRDHHRPVPAARAPDGHGQIRLSFLHILRQGELQERRQPIDELLRLVVLVHEAHDG